MGDLLLGLWPGRANLLKPVLGFLPVQASSSLTFWDLDPFDNLMKDMGPCLRKIYLQKFRPMIASNFRGVLDHLKSNLRPTENLWTTGQRLLLKLFIYHVISEVQHVV